MRLALPPWALLLPLVLTSACGDDATGSARWIGKTYLLDIPAANWTEPRGIGGDIGDFVPQFLFGVDAGGSGDLAITVGTAIEGAQDPCNPTIQVSASRAPYPDVQVLAAEFPMRIAHPVQPIVVNTTIRDLAFANVFPGRTPPKEGEITATADIAEIYPLFTLIPNVTKERVCEQLLAFGAPCVTCAFNGQPYCLTIKAVELVTTDAAAPVAPIAAGGLPASCNP